MLWESDGKHPRVGGGRFLLWVGIALVIGLVVFLLIFLFTGHKASLMKNSQLSAPAISLQR